MQLALLHNAARSIQCKSNSNCILVENMARILERGVYWKWNSAEWRRPMSSGRMSYLDEWVIDYKQNSNASVLYTQRKLISCHVL